MANKYVRSTDGNNADNGSTWALAKATLAGVSAVANAADTVYVSQAHAESTASAVSLTWSGSLSTPVYIVCANDGAEPPTAVAGTATVATTGANALGLNTNGSYVHIEGGGMTFTSGSGSGTVNFTLNTGGRLRAKQCNFRQGNTGGGNIVIGTNTASMGVYEDCGLRWASTSGSIAAAGVHRIRGGSILSGGSAITTLFSFSNMAHVIMEGFDASNAATALVIVSNPGNSAFFLRMVNCKMPASWSGSIFSGSLAVGAVVELINCAAGATNYAYWRRTDSGDIRHETTIVRTGGASDGTTPISWKMVTTSDSVYPFMDLESQEIIIWNSTVGSPLTATVEVVTDNVTLKDNEAWLELRSLDSSAAPLGARHLDVKADILATAANQTSSTETWTTTGLTTPVKQKLSTTFTPQMAGWIAARVHLAKASTTMYADPLLTIT